MDMDTEYNDDIQNPSQVHYDLLMAKLQVLSRALSCPRFGTENYIRRFNRLIPLADVGGGDAYGRRDARNEPAFLPQAFIGRERPAFANVWSLTSLKWQWDSFIVWIFRNRKWFRHGFWLFRKFLGCTWKICKDLLLLLMVISICSSMLWDFRILEPTFLALTDGVLTQKCIIAIQQWQRALNQIIFGLDPKYPIHKFEEESIWAKWTRVFESFWA